MSKKRKRKNATPFIDSDSSEDVITLQYRHIKELSALKYDAEEKREQNLIQQSSQMQAVFSFVTAAIFMAVPICIEYRGDALSLDFFLFATSAIVLFLVVSLVLASLAQWRWKTETFPDVFEIKKSVVDSSEWQKLTIEYYQIAQWVDIVGKVQKKKAELNDRRVRLIMASMICFYCSIFTLAFSFVIGIVKLYD